MHKTLGETDQVLFMQSSDFCDKYSYTPVTMLVALEHNCNCATSCSACHSIPASTKHLKSLHLAKEPEKIVLMGTLNPLVELQVIHATEVF